MMLLELALNGTYKGDGLIGPAYKKRLLGLINRTRHYVFDKDASHKQGRFAMKSADIVCRNANIAIPPFPNTYIEIDNVAALEGGKPEIVITEDAAPKVGYLFTEHGQIFTLSGTHDRAFIMPFVYSQHGSFFKDMNDLNLDIIQQDADDILTTWEDARDVLLVGDVAAELRPTAREFRPFLADLYDIVITRSDIPEELLKMLFWENIGALKRAIAAVLLLNERVGPTITKIPASRRFVGHKLKAFPPHAIITIDLDIPAIRKIYQTTVGHRNSPYLHEVAGHWVHYNVSSQCRHDWVPYHSEDAEKRDLDAHGFPLSRLICSHCGGRRVKKLAFEHGTGDKVIKKDYKVIASKEKLK